MTKFNNVKVPYSLAGNDRCPKSKADITFDSELEYATFCVLKSVLPMETIHVHHPIHLIGKIGWACDFIITPTTNYPKVPVLLVEAKGLVDDVFKLKVELLRMEIPSAWQRLYLVVAQLSPKPVAPEIKQSQLRERLEAMLNVEYNPTAVALTERLLRLKGRVSCPT